MGTGLGAAHRDRFFSLSLDMLCIADFDGYFKDLNPVWERTLGWTLEELRAAPFIEFVHPDDRQATIAEAERLQAGTDTVWFENRYLCKDGSYKWLAWRATASAEDRLYYAVARDVTERRHAEEERSVLLDRERRLAADLRLLLESTAEGIYGIDLRGRCTFINRAGAAMLGYAEEDVLGKEMHSLIHHSRADSSPYPVEECPIYRAFRVGQGSRVDEEVLWRRDGTPFAAEYSSFPIVEDVAVRGAVVTFIDITDRKTAEACIVAERNRLAAILASMADGAVITDPQGRIASVNPALERLGGWREDEVRGRRLAEVYPGFDDRGEPIPLEKRFMSKAIESREAVTSRGYGIMFLTRHGRRTPVSVSAAPVLDAGGELLGAVTVIRDVSYEREVDELKSSLVSTVSHELRTPLTMIQGFSELLLARDLDEQRSSEALEEIHISAERLSRLIDNLLSVSRIESGSLEVRPTRVDLAEVVHALVAPFVQGRDIRVELERGLPAALADRDHLIQILTNLVSNAVKYSPPECPVTVRGTRNGSTIEVSVSDQGIGMTEAELARLFEKFVRADRSEVRDTPGTGLGLFITKRLVEMQRGRIWVRSEPGKGSTFTFSLPLAKASSRLDGTPDSEREAL